MTLDEFQGVHVNCRARSGACGDRRAVAVQLDVEPSTPCCWSTARSPYTCGCGSHGVEPGPNPKARLVLGPGHLRHAAAVAPGHLSLGAVERRVLADVSRHGRVLGQAENHHPGRRRRHRAGPASTRSPRAPTKAEHGIRLRVVRRDAVGARRVLVEPGARGVPHDVVVGEHPRRPGAPTLSLLRTRESSMTALIAVASRRASRKSKLKRPGASRPGGRSGPGVTRVSPRPPLGCGRGRKSSTAHLVNGIVDTVLVHIRAAPVAVWSSTSPPLEYTCAGLVPSPASSRTSSYRPTGPSQSGGPSRLTSPCATSTPEAVDPGRTRSWMSRNSWRTSGWCQFRSGWVVSKMCRHH